MREHWGEDPTIDDQDAFTILVDGEIAGWVGWYEEDDPITATAGLDIFVAPAHQGRGIGREALSLVARWLIDERGHHRIIIDPAASNTRAIATYASLGFRPVGVMRRYERGAGRHVARRAADGPAGGGVHPQLSASRRRGRTRAPALRPSTAPRALEAHAFHSGPASGAVHGRTYR